MSDEPLSIGIDFGATNSSMAWYNPMAGQAEIILNGHGEAKTPSLVYYGEYEILVGNDVLNKIDEIEGYEGSGDPAKHEEVNQR